MTEQPRSQSITQPELTPNARELFDNLNTQRKKLLKKYKAATTKEYINAQPEHKDIELMLSILKELHHLSKTKMTPLEQRAQELGFDEIIEQSDEIMWGLSSNIDQKEYVQLNKSGERLTPDTQYCVLFTHDNRAIAYQNYDPETNQGGEIHLFNEQGQNIGRIESEWLDDMGCGWYLTTEEIDDSEYRYLFIDILGNTAPDANYVECALPFSDNLALIGTKGKNWFIGTNGRNTFRKKFDYANSFVDGIAYVGIKPVPPRGFNEFWFIDTNGEPINNKTYRSINTDLDGTHLLICDNQGGYYHADFHGNQFYSERFDSIGRFTNEYAPAKKDGKWFLINKDGKCVSQKFNNYPRLDPTRPAVSVTETSQHGKPVRRTYHIEDMLL